MSNHRHNPAQSRRDQEISFSDRFVGNATGTPTLPMSTKFGAYIDTIVRNSTGNFTLTFRDKYPELCSVGCAVVGATAGLAARFSAIDITAGTATLITEVGAVATDPATTDTVYTHFRVRNSGQNQ